jgi:hypothetical protein
MTMIYEEDTLVIDMDKITYMVDVEYGYWKIYFVGGSHMRVWNTTAKEIASILKQSEQAKESE